jgi:phage-related tail fiber protein
MADTPKLQGMWTQYGLERLAALLPGEDPLVIAFAALGDGKGGLPIVEPSQTALAREVWRGPVSGVMVNPEDPTDVIVDAFVPNNVGGFFVREWGLYDDTNHLIALGPHDEMHKPLIADGQAAEFLERFHLLVSNAAAIHLTLATQSLVNAAYAWKLDGGDLIMSKAMGNDILDASDGYQGVAVLPVRMAWVLSSDRELIMRLPA